MVTAAAYVLNVPEHRREILLGGPFRMFASEDTAMAEPVPRFDHSRRAPLIVLAGFDDGAITHIASGRKGASAGTGLVRLNMRTITALDQPILFGELVSRAPKRLQAHIQRTLNNGGLLPPKSLGAVVDALLDLQPDLSERLARFSESRAEFIRRLTPTERENLALQKETLATALEISRIGTEPLLTWSPDPRHRLSFLEGMPGAYVREDAAIISDFSTLPGFDAVKDLPFAAKVFQRPDNPSVRLTVIMANRLPLEQQTGADLIYFNETYRSFVMVQYKSMERGSDGPEFRWHDNDQLAAEIARMDTLLAELKQVSEDASPDSFRLHHNPFFLKLCPKIIFNPDDKGLFQGMYLPLDLWKCLATHPATRGPRGGRLLTYDNVGRKLTNSEFVTLIANAWIGTTVPQSAVLEQAVRSVLETGKTVTLAVKTVSDDSDRRAPDDATYDDSGDLPEAPF